MKNAAAHERPDIVLQCQVRIARLVGQEFDGELEREFWTAVAVAEEIATQKNGRATRLSRTRQKVKRVGVVQCLVDWACSPNITQGFSILVDDGHAELTGEAIVVRHAENFSDEAVRMAKEKLAKHGVEAASVKLR